MKIPAIPFLSKKLQENTLVSVEVSPDGVTVAQVTRDGGVPPALKLCEFKPTPGGETAATLAGLCKTHRLDQAWCTSIIQTDAYHLLLVEAPDVDPGELRSAIRWRIKDMIDFHIDDAVVDVFDVPTDERAARNRLMYAVVARAPKVKQLIDGLLDAGLKLSTVDIPELALRNITSLLPEDVGGVVLIYLARKNGLILVTRQSSLYLSRRLDIGMERIMTSGTGAAEGAELDPGVQKMLDSIVIEVQRSLDYYESHFSQPPVSSVVLTPLEQPLPGAINYLSSQLGLPVRQLDLNAMIDCETHLDDAMQARCLATIGAALRVEEVAL